MVKLSEQELIDLHSHSFKNKETLRQKSVAGCFCCCKVFPTSAIKEYTDEGDTAICPNCGIDSVLDEVGENLLFQMNQRWFNV